MPTTATLTMTVAGFATFFNPLDPREGTAYHGSARILSVRPAAPGTYMLGIDAGEGTAHLTVPEYTSITVRLTGD